MILIQYNDCGQSFAKDVGVYEITRDELKTSAAKCHKYDVDDDRFESIDYQAFDHLVFDNLALVDDLLTWDIYGAYCLLTKNASDASLFYVGPDDHYGAVVGAIMAHQRDPKKNPLPYTLD